MPAFEIKNHPFFVKCSRVQDEVAPYVFISLRNTDNPKALAAKIIHEKKVCYVQLRAYDENYRDSHNGLAKDFDSSDKDYIFISQYYREKLNIDKDTSVKLSIISSDFLLTRIIYPLLVAIYHPETTFKTMTWITIIGIFLSIISFIMKFLGSLLCCN